MLPGLPALLLVALYLPALDYDFVWMDYPEIQRGNLILPHEAMLSAFLRPLHVMKDADLGGMQNPYYRPLQLILVSQIYHSKGLNPRYYRAVALAIGALYAASFAFLAWLLFRAFAPALVAALLLVVHPFGIEAFVWISGIAEGLSALWIVGSLIAALMCMGETDRNRAVLYAFLSWALLIVALLTKEKSVVLPVMLLAMMFSVRWAGQPVLTAKTQCAARSSLVTTLLIAQFISVSGYLMVLRPMVLGSGIGSSPVEDSWIVQWLTALAMWPKALGGLLLPLDLSTSDVVRVVESYADPMVWLGLALGTGSLVLWLVLLRTGRGIAAFGLAWLWIAFLPTSNLVPMIHARADRYQFLSVCGAVLFVVAIAPDLLRWVPITLRRVLLGMVALSAILGLAHLNRERIPDWQSTMTLFEHDVGLDPLFREGRFHMALHLYQERLFREADVHIRTLLEQTEADVPVLSNVNTAGLYQLACNNNLALMRYHEAVAVARRIALINPGLGQFAGIRDCLGQALEAQHKTAEALNVYLAIIPHLPGEPPSGLSLAIARTYTETEDSVNGRMWLRRAMQHGLGTAALRGEAKRIQSRLDSMNE